MENRFRQFIEHHALFTKDNRLLLAISGGADSVALAYLLKSAGYLFAMAHCNFRLRAAESDEDEQFVRLLAKNIGCELFVTSFDTEEYAQQKSVSIEMAARDLRYAWFETVRQQYAFDYIVTAHHQDDNAETMLLNQIRGTGLRGLQGILPKNQRIVRPLLCCSKIEILTYMNQHDYSYRIDSSNLESIYKRNKLRNDVFPLLMELNPSVIKTFNENATRFADAFRFYSAHMSQELSRLVRNDGEIEKIEIKTLEQSGFTSLFLYEWLHTRGYNFDDIETIVRSLSAQSGKRFLSQNYILVKDREYLLLSPRNETDIDVSISETDSLIEYNHHRINIEKMPIHQAQYKQAKSLEAFFDKSKMHFPLKIRKWKAGDSFIPLGMKNHKKVSDFLIDEKMSVVEKQQVVVLENARNEILWIVGFRMSEIGKITTDTTLVVRMTIMS